MKKPYLLFASFSLLFILFLVSCQKEKSFEKGGIDGSIAQYTLDGGTGSCTGALVSGTYTAGIAVTTANTVTVNVDVDSIGFYNISTNTVNGISFSSSGVFTSTGIQTVTLTASGTPVTAGSYDFTPGANGCTFSISVAVNNGAAAYSLNGGSGACTGAVIHGTYTAGTATSSANSVALNVQVDKVGTYSISTNTVNGIKFVATGSFVTTGAQTVILLASGTPTSSGSFTYTPGSNGCTFNVSVVAGNNPGGGSGGSGSGNFLRCKINGVLTNFNTGLIGYYVPPPTSGIPFSISVQGKKSDVANSVEELWVQVTNPTAPTTGAYSNRTFTNGMTDRASQVIYYPNGFPNLYWSSSVLTANSLTVNITSVTTSGATGTFQGTIYESNGGGPASKTVTEGEFKISF